MFTGQLAHILWLCATIQLPSNIPCSSHAIDVARRVPECFSIVESTRDHFVAAPHSSCPFALCLRPKHVYSYAAHKCFPDFQFKMTEMFLIFRCWRIQVIGLHHSQFSAFLCGFYLFICIKKQQKKFMNHVQFRLKNQMNLSYCSS